MTREEAKIMKALECCGYNAVKCFECPYMRKDSCAAELMKDCYDLINRKNAEIERLKSMNQAKLDMIHYLREELETNDKAKAEVLGLQKEIKTARAEATKEFLERVRNVLSLEKRLCRKYLDNDGAFMVDKVRKDIDQIAKEMEVEL